MSAAAADEEGKAAITAKDDKPTPTPPPRPTAPASLRYAPKSGWKAMSGWSLPSDPPHIHSRELDWLKADLSRYASEQIRGRSYLIAGHRGAGKSSLVARAALQLATDTITLSVKENPAGLPEGGLQRPLLVKLHGPSMLASAEPETRASAAPQTGEQQPAGTDTRAAGSVHTALVQITLGLYRALAAEVALGFRAHALGTEKLEGSQPADRVKLAQRAERMELATQLALELDSGATPALLRSYWQRIGRLSKGVLWPESADTTMATLGTVDQGLREIAAVATAGQAFKVCTGRISYTDTAKDNIERTTTTELKAAGDWKEAVNRLGTLGLGAATGVALIGNGTTTAILGGIAVWLLGSLGVTWSRKSTRADSRSVEYSFIRDFTLATLERDLPVVITRVRQAGLAPVFLIDELDKVTEATTEVSRLVGRLKHLVADFGFFCFLVNRDCYDEIETRIRSGAYPEEHTLFSVRLLLRPDPDHVLKWLVELFEASGEGPEAERAKVVLALNLMHDARLNLTELMRSLQKAVGGTDGVIGTAVDLTQQRRLVLATIQLAINDTLRSERLAERMDEDAGFAQLAIDMVYAASRSIAGGELHIDPSIDALRERLQERMRDGRAAACQARELDASDLKLLHEHFVLLLKLLSDLPALRARLSVRGTVGAAGSDVRLADIPPADLTEICRKQRDGHYEVLYRRDGRRAGIEPGQLTPEQGAEITRRLGYLAAFEALLAQVGVTVEELAATPLLASASSGGLAQAQTELSAALRLNEVTEEVLEQLSALRRFAAEIEQNDEALAWLLTIVASLRVDAGDDRPILAVVGKLIRFDLPGWEWLTKLPSIRVQPLPIEQGALQQWREELGSQLLPAAGKIEYGGPGDYEQLRDPMLEWLAGNPDAGKLQVDYRLLVQAIAGWLPAAALHADLTKMPVADWSRLVWAAVPKSGGRTEAPLWVFVAALAALGFSRSSLESFGDPEFAADLGASGWMAEPPGSSLEQCLETVRQFIYAAPEHAEPGVLIVEGAGGPVGGDPPTPRRPMLIVEPEGRKAYADVLDWLREGGLLASSATQDVEVA